MLTLVTFFVLSGPLRLWTSPVRSADVCFFTRRWMFHSLIAFHPVFRRTISLDERVLSYQTCRTCKEICSSKIVASNCSLKFPLTVHLLSLDSGYCNYLWWKLRVIGRFVGETTMDARIPDIILVNAFDFREEWVALIVVSKAVRLEHEFSGTGRSEPFEPHRSTLQSDRMTQFSEWSTTLNNICTWRECSSTGLIWTVGARETWPSFFHLYNSFLRLIFW